MGLQGSKTASNQLCGLPAIIPPILPPMETYNPYLHGPISDDIAFPIVSVDTGKEPEVVYGYKGFNSDMTCISYQYQLGVKHSMPTAQIEICKKGFHFCFDPKDVLTFYPNEDGHIYAKIKAEGVILMKDNKCVAEHLTVMELITYDQLLEQPSFEKNYIVKRNIIPDNPVIEDDAKHGEVADDSVSIRTRHNRTGSGCDMNEDITIKLGRGYTMWNVNGTPHRLDGPALIKSSGVEVWFRNGILHCENGPAFKGICSTYWVRNGSYHRTDGPAVELCDPLTGKRMQFWLQNNLYHRVDGPAIETDCIKLWYYQGVLQRSEINPEKCQKYCSCKHNTDENDELTYSFNLEYNLINDHNISTIINDAIMTHQSEQPLPMCHDEPSIPMYHDELAMPIPMCHDMTDNQLINVC